MTGKRKGRGRLSSVDLIPEDIRVELNAALQERRLTQEEIREAVNGLLTDRGEKSISKSAFNRYAVHTEERRKMMREARESADALVSGLGAQKDTDLGRALTEIIKTLTYDRIMSEELDVDSLGKLALLVQRLQRTTSLSQDMQEKIRRQAMEEAMAAIEEDGKDQVMDEAWIKEQKKKFGL